MQFIFTIFSRFLVKGFNLLTFLILARLLSLDDFALYGFVFNTALLLAILFDLGLRNSGAFFIGKYPHATKEITDAITHYLIYASLGVMLTVSVIMFLSRPELENYYQFFAIALICFGALTIRTLQGVFIGIGAISVVNRSDILQKSALLACIFLLFILTWDNLTLVLYCLSTSTLLTAFFLIIKVRKLDIPPQSNLGPDLQLKGMFIRGLIFMFGALFMVGYKKVGFYVVSVQGDPSLAGVYFGVNRFAEVITEIGLAVSLVLFSNTVRGKSHEKNTHHLAKTTRVSLFVLSFIGIAMVFFSHYILHYGLGSSFAQFSTFYSWAVVAAIFGIIPTILFPSLSVIYHPMKVATLYGAAVLANLIGSILLFSYFNLLGIAITLAISNFLLSAIILFIIHSKERISPWKVILVQKEDFMAIKKVVYKLNKRKA